MADRGKLPSEAFLEAASFAARAHRWQMRKDGATPYVSHPFRVCLIVRHVFGIDDPAALTAAVLHDTVEDTNTDFDDIEKAFGREVAEWVALLSKDKRMREEERERAYCDGLRAAPWQVKICKLGDLYDNITDSAFLTPDKRPRTYQRSRRYLDALAAPDLPPPVQRAFQTVTALLERFQAGI